MPASAAGPFKDWHFATLSECWRVVVSMDLAVDGPVAVLPTTIVSVDGRHDGADVGY